MNTPMQSDPREMARRFNEDEAVWQRYEQKRLDRLLSRPRWPLAGMILDEFDWREAEAEVRETRCIGVELP
jgi:hypothetical protein